MQAAEAAREAEMFEAADVASLLAPYSTTLARCYLTLKLYTVYVLQLEL